MKTVFWAYVVRIDNVAKADKWIAELGYAGTADFAAETGGTLADLIGTLVMPDDEDKQPVGQLTRVGPMPGKTLIGNRLYDCQVDLHVDEAGNYFADADDFC